MIFRDEAIGVLYAEYQSSHPVHSTQLLMDRHLCSGLR